MKKLLFLLALLAFTYHPLYAQSSTPAWLSGPWQLTSGSNPAFESWQQLDENTFAGKGYFMQQTDTVVFEELRLQKIGNYWCYIATVHKGKPVLFYHTLMEAGHMVFENPEHDFPQRIEYQLKEDGTLSANVSGMEKGKERKEEFNMKKLSK